MKLGFFFAVFQLLLRTFQCHSFFLHEVVDQMKVVYICFRELAVPFFGLVGFDYQNRMREVLTPNISATSPIE